MQIVEFYRGERGNQNGTFLVDILGWSDDALEVDHDYVQWMFPSNEPSSLNGEAPTLTWQESQIFSADPELQENVKLSLVRMLSFFGFALVQDDDIVKIEALEPTAERPNPQWWLGAFNHNMLRVTRVFKSLRCTGLTRYAVAFYDALRPYAPREGEFAVVSPNTWGHWTRAVFNPLWE